MKDSMKNIKKALITMIAIVGLTTNVSAFEGFSVGAVYSQNDFSTSGVETTGAAGGTGVTHSTPLENLESSFSFAYLDRSGEDSLKIILRSKSMNSVGRGAFFSSIVSSRLLFLSQWP